MLQSGGLDSFMHLFTLEALAIARAHVAAIGGNTLLNFRLNDCVLIEHLHKNQVGVSEHTFSEYYRKSE